MGPPQRENVIVAYGPTTLSDIDPSSVFFFTLKKRSHGQPEPI